MKRTILSLLALVAIFFVAEAQKAPKPIKLLIKAEQNEALQGLNPKLGKLSIGDDVKVNGEIYTVQSDKDGKLFVEVAKTKEGIYKASYPADVSFVEDDPTTPHIRLVPSQLYEPGAFNRFYMPLRAEQAVDNTLEFKSACGVVHIKVKGDAALNCLKIEDNAGGYLAGYFNLNAEEGVLVRKATAAGIYSLVVECSNDGEGVKLSDQGVDFYAVLPVGNYDKGLKLSFTDRNHHTASCTTKPLVVKRGEICSVEPVTYTYPENQLFSEKFDNMVYGGDYMRGKFFKGFSALSASELASAQIIGIERALYLQNYNGAGTDYIHSNWQVKPAEECKIGAEYLRNRNLMEYASLLRAQEYLGYLGVGVKNNDRGIFTSPAFSEIKEHTDIEISFKFSPQSRTTSDYDLLVLNSGVIKEFWIDGVRHTLTSSNYPFHSSNSERIALRRGIFWTGIADDEQKPWFSIRLVVSGATKDTALSIVPQNMGPKERNGFFIDDIEVTKLRSVPREKILRIMDYNVQNGIWSVQADNYDLFVEYMKEQDIDIAVFCEASTIYYNHTGKGSKFEERYLPYKYQPYEKGKTEHLEPTGWIELAARYGHSYVAIGAHQDNYPVVVTSKYPIVKSVRLGGPEVSHGGIHAQVDVEGEIINVVGFHTWPQAWAMGIRGKEARHQSRLENGGHKTRYDETKLFMERTILNPEYADQKNWIITGDMNCASPLDDATFDHGYDSPRYAGQRFIVENVKQVKDLVKLYNNPDKRDVVVPSTMGTGRIDLMYGSEKFVRTLIKAKSPKYGFTKGAWDSNTHFYKDRGSDHLPVICDFEWR